MTPAEAAARDAQKERVRRQWNGGWLTLFGPRPGLYSKHRYAPDHWIVRSMQDGHLTWWACSCGEVSNFGERRQVSNQEAARSWVAHVENAIPRITWTAP